ncbi:MAG: ABC transporter substrate-binding protein [Eubacteriales bacterium]|nr:ABC transporter substrate-binding protein [Eubacteriales bacterium]MDD3349834.1 ABC transporter substrate-binding protein [Eubacteriales bacterium]
MLGTQKQSDTINDCEKNTKKGFRHKINDKKRSFVLCFFVVLLAFSTTACSTFERFSDTLKDQADEDTIKIGILEPMSGEDAEAAKAEIIGIELAHEAYPEVSGKKVELIYADHRSEISYVETAAKELIDQGVVLAIGSYGNSYSLAAGSVFKEAEIPIIGATCNNPLVTVGNPYYFRVSIVDSFQGTMAAKYVYNDLDKETAIVMKASGDDYGTALSQHFSDKMTAMTGEKDAVSMTLEYKKGAINFGDQIKQLKSAGNYPVYLPCSPEDAAMILKQARRAGLENVFIGTERWYQDSLLEESGTYAEGIVFTTFSDIEASLSENSAKFFEAYEEKYGEEEPKSAVVLGYDAYLLAIDALARLEYSQTFAKETENTTEAAVKIPKLDSLRDALAATKEFKGATGSLSFGESGDPIKPVVFMTVQNGEFQYKYTATPEWGS